MIFPPASGGPRCPAGVPFVAGPRPNQMTLPQASGARGVSKVSRRCPAGVPVSRWCENDSETDDGIDREIDREIDSETDSEIDREIDRETD
eukprot:9430163-Pyramimonas_sp.AAC.1